ncbi:hypothetical protein OG474_24630 [Kribbella sp. NBC_01505]|uniref:hypothetical protein n=1 Tax=Kribbella sp. NBC_01505 TaxID=2903580 RepID=UPI0038665B0E
MAKRSLLTGIVLLAVAGLTGCSSGPTISELGPQLQQEGTQQLDAAADYSGVDGVKPTITEDASKDVPCGDGKVKRVFAGSFPFEPGASLDTTFDLAFISLRGRIDGKRYDLVTQPDKEDLTRREAVFAGKDDNKLTLTFVFTGGATPTFALRGETACLEA